MKHPSDEAWGAGWKLVNDEFKTWILRLASLTKVVFISHAKEVETEIQKIKVFRTQPTISGQAGKFISGMVDMIAYVSNDPVDRDKRVVYFRGHDALVAGDRTNKLDSVMPFNYVVIKDVFSAKPDKENKKNKDMNGGE